MPPEKKTKNKRKPERTATQRERDKRIISELYLRGELQADIAKAVYLSQSTVSNDLATLREEWLASSLMDFNDRRAQELAKVDDLEREYWTAWKRSQQDAEVKTQKMIDRPEGQSKEAQKRTEGQVGDPRFLAGIQWCVNKRCELLGLDAPKKAEITGKDGEPLQPKAIDHEGFDRAMFSLAAAIREIVPAKDTKQDSEVEAAK